MSDLRILPIEDWPALDRSLWARGVEPRGLFERGGRGADWSEHSRRKTAGGYGFFLCWLQAQSAWNPEAGPTDRVTRDRVVAYVAELRRDCAPYTVLCRVQELYDAVRVMAPEADWGWLVQIYRALRAQVRPSRDKLSRLKPIDELASLGERLMEEAEAAPDWSARRRAVGYRDGLMIAVLAYRPVRLKNFARMRLGHHLTKIGGRWQILLAAEETKSHVPYEGVFPSALEPGLKRYLEVHRTVLMRGERTEADAPPVSPELDAVWVSQVGTQLEEGAVARRIVKHTKAAFGRSVPPHWFRDAAATSIAIDNPRHIGDASLVLGHAGLSTTERHYNNARSLEASRRHAATLAGLRETLGVGRKG
jgi:integrase/recombinase XerD